MAKKDLTKDLEELLDFDEVAPEDKEKIQDIILELDALTKLSETSLMRKLLSLNKETFDLAKRIYIDGKVKFYTGPVIGDKVFPPMFNVNILKELNLEQLRFLGGLLMQEIEERLKKK